LAWFDTNIKHIPGISNSAADALSRYPYAQQEMDANATTIINIDNTIYDAMQRSYIDDKLFGPVIQNPKQYPTYTIKNGLIYH